MKDYRDIVKLLNINKKETLKPTHKSGKKTLIISGAIAAGIAASTASYLTTRFLVNSALDREGPKGLKITNKKISGSNQDKELDELVKEKSEILKKTVTDTIEITAADGVKLVGHWYPCENAKRIIIAMHGWRSSWSKDFCMVADFWHENGCSVLFAEQRGQNNSGGDYMGFGLSERYDCIEWINRISQNENSSLPIYLAGISMGATTVLMASGLNLPDRVHGIMADCGFTSPNDIWKHVVKNNLHLSFRIREALINQMFRRKTKMNIKDCSTDKALANCKVPVLFIHGTGDKFVPVEMTYKNYLACPSEKRLLIVPGAEHGMSYLLEKEKYENTVKSFWEQFD